VTEAAAGGSRLCAGPLELMTTMQVAVQDRILTAVALDRDVSTSEVLAGCPESANERDFLRAVWLLFSANALTGPPLALTDEGRRRLVPAWRRSRDGTRPAEALTRQNTRATG
jgi:hypothetical protein